MPGTRKLGRPTDHRRAMLRAMVTYMFWGWLLLLLWRHQARKNNNYYQY